MKLLKMFALSYLIKTVLFGIACLIVPDLPSRTLAFARQTWARIYAAPAATAAAPAAAALPVSESKSLSR